MIISKRERDWLESLKRQTQRDVESGRLDAVESYRLSMGRQDPPIPPIPPQN